MNRKQFGEFIKTQRVAQNMTQKELAEKAKLSRRQAVLEIEKDMCDYGLNVLIVILKTLGYELDIKTLISVAKTSLNFTKIKRAKPEDDPSLEISKEFTKFAKQKSNKNEKSSR